MTSILVSEVSSRLGRAVHDLLASRGLSVAVADENATAEADAALIITDLGPGLMARATPENPGTAGTGIGEDRHAVIRSLIASAAARGRRIVLVSGLQQTPGMPPVTDTDRDSVRIEALLAQNAAQRAVILRVSDVMDPTDPDLQAAVRALIDASANATWPPSDHVQVIALTDLAAAVVAATQVRGVEGRWFDIVHPKAAGEEEIRAEAQRIAQIFDTPDMTEIKHRMDDSLVAVRRHGAAAAEALGVRPQNSLYVLLAQTIQLMAADAFRLGVAQPVQPPMPAVWQALETGALPLAGCCAVVTGVTGKVGSATARMLVRLGANVTGLALRPETGLALEHAFAEEYDFLARQRRRLDAERLRRDGGAGGQSITGDPGRLRVLSADLTDRKALAAIAERLAAELPQIDILIHAAGATSQDRRQTAQGIEAVLALQMLAPVALTRLLAEPLCRANSAWVLNPVTLAQADHPFELNDLQSTTSYRPTQVVGRAQSGLVALTGALAEGMAGTNVNIAAVALPPVPTPFLLPSEGPQPGAQTQVNQRYLQMHTPSQAAAMLIEVMLSQDFAQAHGCLIVGETVAGPILMPADDRGRIGALWTACAALSGLAE